MATYTIDTDNNITAFAVIEDALNHRVGTTEGAFSGEKELAKLSAEWPAARFVEVWNSFAGVAPFDSLKPVKKFTDRKTAVNRIWKAIQALTPAPAQHAAPVAPKKAKATKPRQPGRRRAPRARGQQEGQGPGVDPPAGRRHLEGHPSGHRLAIA